MKLFSEDGILQGYHFIKLKTSCPHSFHMNALFELDTIRAVVIICWTSSLVGVVVVVSGFLSAVFDVYFHMIIYSYIYELHCIFDT